MKKLNYIKTAVFSLLATALLSSCLKDNKYVNYSSYPVVDFPAVPGSGQVQAAVLSSTATTNSVNFLVSGSSAGEGSSAVTCTAIVDATAVPTGYTLLPATTYTIVSGLTLSFTTNVQQVLSNREPLVGTPVVLPQGMSAFIFNVNTAAYQALSTANKYCLPLTLTSASGNGAVVDQYKTIIYEFTIK